MRKINETYFRLLQLASAFTQIIGKWMLGVVLRKLIDASFHDGDLVALTQPTRPLLNLIFLYNLSFFAVVGIAVMVVVVATIITSLMVSWASIKAGQTGRTLRGEILERAVTAPGSISTNTSEISHTANDLIVKLKLVEDFQAFDEHWVFVDKTIVTLSFLLSLTFAWYAGLAALACFTCAMVCVSVFEKLRSKFMIQVKTNATKVNSRLLDTVKNGTKIKIMDQLAVERRELVELEESADDARATDATLKFYREMTKNVFLGILPPVMGLVGWGVIANSDAALSIDIGSAILVATLLLDEGHKALLHLSFVLDKQVGAIQAQSGIDRFLGQQVTEDLKSTHTHKTLDTDDASHIQEMKEKEVDDTAAFSDSSSGHIDYSSDCDVERASQDIVDCTWTRTYAPDGNGVTLTNVVLCYPGRDYPILNSYTHSFARGKIHALVGESGSGKSSLLKAIADLIQPESGSIGYWSGINVAYVSQEQRLFARTVRENVAYGVDGKNGNDEIWRALKAANIDQWVASLPNGLDEVLTAGEGVVSGGQVQRLNLAHLFYTCSQHDFCLLDEVLSALDQSSRSLLLGRLKTFLQGKTAIIITHHAEMLEICDEVHEMESPSIMMSLQKRRRQEKIYREEYEC